MGRRNEDEPLRDEARAREEWRGGDTQLPPADGGGHCLPASEDDDEASGQRAGDPQGHPRTIAPPD